MLIVIACRRYCCVSCGATLTVVPRGGAPRRHYGHAAITMALTLWAIAREPVAEVRRRVCAWSATFEAASRWPALERWGQAPRAVLGDPGLTLIAAAARRLRAMTAVPQLGAPPALAGPPTTAGVFGFCSDRPRHLRARAVHDRRFRGIGPCCRSCAARSKRSASSPRSRTRAPVLARRATQRAWLPRFVERPSSAALVVRSP